mmetsp:Transcript_35614/g.113945  ORF Transcript_35614/g.113945 Transcript_35614/m.113945 type:complete len:229 (+) Transcript_35614:2207-2893(+)
MSHARMRKLLFEASSERSCAPRPCPARVMRPLRDESTRCEDGSPASAFAARSPRPPSPPVMMLTPAPLTLSALEGMAPVRTSLGACHVPLELWASSLGTPPSSPKAAAARSIRATSVADGSERTSRMSQSAAGCSRATLLRNPQTPPAEAAAIGSASSNGRGCCVPRQRHNSLGGGFIWMSCLVTASSVDIPTMDGAAASCVSASRTTFLTDLPPTSLSAVTFDGCSW